MPAKKKAFWDKKRPKPRNNKKTKQEAESICKSKG